jgi:hypothetical protein
MSFYIDKFFLGAFPLTWQNFQKRDVCTDDADTSPTNLAGKTIQFEPNHELPRGTEHGVRHI